MNHRPLIAIVHYHLRSGGVTKVISQAVKALEMSQIDSVIISGSDLGFCLPHNASSVVLNELAYQKAMSINPKILLDELNRKALIACGREPDIWHFHNHSIGKNISLTLAANMLVQNGKNVLFQIHDFPEDGRPLNYSELRKYTCSNTTLELEEVLYPKSPNTHYAVLNNRDLTYLSRAGFLQENLHLLLNPVNLASEGKKNSTNPFKNKKLWLYPSRCIRRKNMGEFLLWSALADNAENLFASTLKPTSPADIPFYDRWKALASEYKLPIEFEIGLRYQTDFTEWMENAKAIVTTSVGEGFGLAFLEPFLFKKPIVGRDIEEITIDFKNNGISYRSLYKALRFPVDWIGRDTLYESIKNEMIKLYRSYNTQYADSMPELAYNAAVLNGYADFGRLNEELQEKVIRQIISKPSLKDSILPLSLQPEEYDKESFDRNYDLTCQYYGLTAYRDNLLKIYNSILNPVPSESVIKQGNTVLEQFLCPENFYLLRS